MNPAHDGAPQNLGDIRFFARVLGAQADIVVISGPYAAGVIGGISREPYIPVIRGGTGLASDGHVAVEIAACAGAADLHHVHHGVRQQEGSGLLDDLL